MLGVYQSDNITATADKTGGFSSGDATASGRKLLFVMKSIFF